MHTTFFTKSIMLLWIGFFCASVILRAQSESLPWQRMLASREMVNRYLVSIARQLTNDAAAEFHSVASWEKVKEQRRLELQASFLGAAGRWICTGRSARAVAACGHVVTPLA